MKKHAEIGYNVLRSSPYLREAAEVVRGHHEHYDGSGYPEGLEGEAIPLESRIIGVADAVDAMMRDETHRPILSLEHVLAELREGAGKQFDAQVVIAFAKLAERAEVRDRLPFG